MQHTALADARELSAFFDSLAPPKEDHKKDGRPKHEKRSKLIRRAKRAAVQSSVRGGSGGVVGAGAAAVGEENVGHRLLVGMGWTGGGLGRDGEGITEPVQALMRQSRAGLGM